MLRLHPHTGATAVLTSPFRGRRLLTLDISHCGGYIATSGEIVTDDQPTALSATPAPAAPARGAAGQSGDKENEQQGSLAELSQVLDESLTIAPARRRRAGRAGRAAAASSAACTPQGRSPIELWRESDFQSVAS